MKFKLMSGIVLIIVLFVGFVYIDTTDGLNSNYKTLDMLNKYLNTNPNVSDYFNEIGFDNIEDIKFYCDEDQTEMTIKFGDVKMSFDRDDFLDEDTLEKLGLIGITVRENKKTGKLSLYWHDEKITKYIK